ncbi:MAG: hypothetical protein ACOYLC_15590 [Armatimonadaceae bacterium]
MLAPPNRGHLIGNHFRGAVRAGGGAVHSINSGREIKVECRAPVRLLVVGYPTFADFCETALLNKDPTPSGSGANVVANFCCCSTAIEPR